MSLYRDVIVIIASHVDLRTWARLKRASRIFNGVLSEHQDTVRLQRMFRVVSRRHQETLQWKRSCIQPLKEKCENMFFVCLARFLHHVNNVIDLHKNQIPLCSKQLGCNARNIDVSCTLDRLRKIVRKRNQKEFHLPIHDAVICYPWGYIYRKKYYVAPYCNIFNDPSMWDDIFVFREMKLHRCTILFKEYYSKKTVQRHVNDIQNRQMMVLNN